MSAISPFNTLISCGNSSKDEERTNFPTFVNLCASGNSCPSVPRSSVIVLNLITLNIFASFPGLSWVKKAPAPLFAKCSHIVTTNKIGDITINAINEIQKSRNRLKKCLYIFLLYLFMPSKPRFNRLYFLSCLNDNAFFNNHTSFYNFSRVTCHDTIWWNIFRNYPPPQLLKTNHQWSLQGE